jgi:hypothetical protein
LTLRGEPNNEGEPTSAQIAAGAAGPIAFQFRSISLDHADVALAAVALAARLAPALGQHLFLPRLRQRRPANLVDVVRHRAFWPCAFHGLAECTDGLPSYSLL